MLQGNPQHGLMRRAGFQEQRPLHPHVEAPHRLSAGPGPLQAQKSLVALKRFFPLPRFCMTHALL